MSWSISSTGKAKHVAEECVKQAATIKLSDEGEQQTVGLVAATIAQTLRTFDPDKLVRVSASGHMGFADWKDKSGPFQQVALNIEPIHLTVSG